MDILFISFFVGLMVLAVVWFWRIRDQHVNVIASIVTVIGVLGTFAGIAWGLLNFDTSDIEASVPKLLDGLRVAFLTSIAGILGSIGLKWSNLNKQKKQSGADDPPIGATIDTLAQLLHQLLTSQEEEGKETKAALQSIERSLTGEGESTVVTQLSRLRIAFIDKQDDLVRAFNQFAEQMAENNSKALIEALEEVMRDFNAKINEQFGDNFKQLNEAVGRINEWQDQYRQQMDELAAEFRIAAESVEISRQSLATIADHSNVIVTCAENLAPVLQTVQDQIDRVNPSLEAFSRLAENAREAFPRIENRLDELTNGFSQAVQNTIDTSHASMERQREALTEQSAQLEKTVENTGNYIQQQTVAVFERTSEQVQNVIDVAFQGLRTALENQYKQLDTTILSMNQTMAETLQTQSAQLQTTLENTSGEIKEMANGFSTVVRDTIDDSHASMQNQRQALSDFSDKAKESIDNAHSDVIRQREAFQDFTGRVETVIQNTSQGLERNMEETRVRLERTLQTQFATLDKLLGDELVKVLETLGSQLTSLSNKFVADYTPLTDRLRRVLEIARNIPIREQSNQRQTQ